MSAASPIRLPRLSIRNLRSGLAVGLALLALAGLAGRAHADCSDPAISTYKWCGSLDIPIWWGPGLGGECNGTGSAATDCQRWRAAVRAVIQEFNPAAVVELEVAPFLMEAGPWDGSPTGIVVRLGDNGWIDCAGGSGFSEALGKMKPHVSAQAGGPMHALQYAEITFNRQVPWNDPGVPGAESYHRTTVARHEIMHALGVGHATGGLCLMNTTLPCGWSETIEESAWAALRCLYGDPWGSCSGLYGIDAGTPLQATVSFSIAGCGCNSGGCPAKQAAQPAALTYELAISESGGPYTVFATLQDSDLVDHQYTHEFTQSYQSGMVRMRVLNGASLVDEAFILEPVTVELAGTPAPPAVATQQPLRLLSAPNPFTSQTVLSFALGGEQDVEVTIYDTAGRRVATVHSGRLSAGPHEMMWDGRLEGGGQAASGVYHCTVRTASGSVTKTLAKVR